MQMILHLVVLALTIVALSRFSSSVHIKSMGSAVLVAVVFSVLNFLVGWLIGWVVKAVLFVPAIFTLGLLFILVPFIVNTVLLWATDKVMASFRIDSVRGLVMAAAVITAVNALLHAATYSASWGHARWV